MHTTFRQLRLFIALVETHSVSGAAKLNHVTQPTASMQLKELSQNIGEPLFEVVAKKIHLTQAGECLAQTAKNMLEEWGRFEQEIAQMKSLTKGRLKVAAVSTAKHFIPQMLGHFCQIYPDVDISIEVLNRDGVLKRLEQNMDDLYIMSIPPQNIEINDQIFMSNPITIIASKHHPVTKKGHLELKDLKDEKFIMREKGSGTRMAIDDFFRKTHFKPLIRLELGSNEAIRNSVAANLGIAAVSVHSLDFNHKSEIEVLRVQDFPILSNWHIVSLKGKKLSPIASIFKDHLMLEAINKQNSLMQWGFFPPNT